MRVLPRRESSLIFWSSIWRSFWHDPALCEHMAEENCSIKYHVVMKDEREESGLREVLNPGSYGPVRP